MNVTNILPVLQTVLAFFNICVLGFTFYKFLNRPHNSLEEKHKALEKRVDEHDLKIKEMDISLKQGNDRFRKQEETNATFKSVMLSFINFEIAYCSNTGYEDNQDLLDAKRELSEYLTGKRHEDRD